LGLVNYIETFIGWLLSLKRKIVALLYGLYDVRITELVRARLV